MTDSQRSPRRRLARAATVAAATSALRRALSDRGEPPRRDRVNELLETLNASMPPLRELSPSVPQEPESALPPSATVTPRL